MKFNWVKRHCINLHSFELQYIASVYIRQTSIKINIQNQKINVHNSNVSWFASVKFIEFLGILFHLFYTCHFKSTSINIFIRKNSSSVNLLICSDFFYDAIHPAIKSLCSQDIPTILRFYVNFESGIIVKIHLI